TRVLTHQHRDRLPGVTGGGDDLQLDLTERDRLPVGQQPDRVVGLGTDAVADPRPGRLGQLEVPGDEVGVEVGVDHGLDRQAAGLGLVEILGDVAAGVHDHRAPGRLVADQVRGVGQAVDVVLLENHGRSSGFQRYALDTFCDTP